MIRRRRPFVHRLGHAAAALAVGALLGLRTASAAAAFVPHPCPGHLMLTLREGVALQPVPGKAGGPSVTGRPSIDALNATFGVRAFAALFPGETRASKALAGQDLSRYFLLEFDPGVDLDAIRAAFGADPAVESAEFDMMMPLDREPNDLGSQWHVESSTGHDAHLTGGWNHTTGSANVLLAIADSGVDWQHPDLGANIWINTAEQNGVAGVDDDANGFVDDVRGWDFVGSLSGAWPGEDAVTQDNDPRDFNGHGTHCSGIASAVTDNGVGVCGVAWNCKIMALRIGGSIDSGGNEQGVVLMSSAAAAVNYARVKGATAFSCSWGSSNAGGLGAAVSAAIAQGMVFCVAAGNDAATSQSYLGSRGDCLDVAATDSGDALASFSNRGVWIDVCAPGVAINSTYFFHAAPVGQEHGYALLQGTSMATPLVAGLVGLVKANNPALTGAQIRAAIQAGCDNIDAFNPGLAGLMGAGRVNALRTFKDYHLTIPNDYPSFEKALTASGAGDTLALQGGPVFNSGWFVTKNQRLIQGGWNANFTARDPFGNPTLVQRGGVGPALEFAPGILSSLIIDGVSFSGGVARNLSSPLAGTYGGGVLCIDSSPVLRNCRFEFNASGDAFTLGGGAGGFFANSSALLDNCIFQNNSAATGAGLYVAGGNLTMTNGLVLANTGIGTSSATAGAGIYLDGGILTLNGTTVEGNSGVQEGGGVYVKAGTLNAAGARLRNNSAAGSGGNLRLTPGTAATLNASELRAGGATFGAGAALAGGSVLTLRSTVVSANQATVLGGGIYAAGANATLENVTFDANHAAAGGGDAFFASASPAPWVLRNSLLSNHTSTLNATCTFSGGAAPQSDYNTFWNNAVNVSGLALGAQDLVENPLYVDAATGDYALGLHSPALDRGDPAGSANDPDGTRNDRGAYGGPNAVSRAPQRPAGLTAQQVNNPLRNVLAWTSSPSPDVQSYAVYRGADAAFVPSAVNFLALVPVGTLSYSDPAGTTASYYRVGAIDLTSAASGFTPASPVTPATDVVASLPQRFTLHPNLPNPFNPATVLSFDLPAATHVRLQVVDGAGRVVRHLLDESRPAGVNRVAWDGRDDQGRGASSGTYFAHLVAGPERATRKMILVR